MPTTIAILLFVATAPIGLLPAILGLFQRLPGAGWIAFGNALLWISFPISQGLAIPGISVAVALILWLLLLRLVVIKSRSSKDAPEPTRSEGTEMDDNKASPDTSLERTREG